MRKKLFSVSIHDCRVDTFRSGGKGGQNQNKVESGVRVVHEPSGAVGEARDSRDQWHNKRNAFRRMAESQAFRNWVNVVVAEMDLGKTIDQLVEEEMNENNLKVEIRTSDGWKIVPAGAALDVN